MNVVPKSRSESSGTTAPSAIAVSELLRSIDAGEQVVVLDVRNGDEFAAWRIEGRRPCTTLLAPHRLPFERMEEWYRAYDRFARLVRDPRHQYRVKLRPGDYVLYDNHRMLHARTGFRGGRWLRGIYFDA